MTGGNGAANTYRGETPLTLAGKTYLLRLHMNVNATLEEVLDARGILPQVLRVAGFKTVRAVFHVCLTAPNRRGERHLPADTSVDAVGWMIEDEGGFLEQSPLSRAYFALLYNGGFLTDEEAELVGAIPPGKADAGAGLAGAPEETAAATPGT